MDVKVYGLFGNEYMELLSFDKVDACEIAEKDTYLVPSIKRATRVLDSCPPVKVCMSLVSIAWKFEPTFHEMTLPNQIMKSQPDIKIHFLLQGNYTFDKWYPDLSVLPTNIPPGSVKIKAEIKSKGEVLMLLTIQYDFKVAGDNKPLLKMF